MLIRSISSRDNARVRRYEADELRISVRFDGPIPNDKGAEVTATIFPPWLEPALREAIEHEFRRDMGNMLVRFVA